MESLKDQLIKKTAKELELSDVLCDKVVNWSFKAAKEATLAYREVEISGFGTLRVSKPKLNKRILKFEAIKEGTQSKLTELGGQNWEKRMKSAGDCLAFLQTKIK